MQNKYPLWKNLLLIFVIILGIVYVIPNLYTEYPVVQVSSLQPIDLSELKSKVETILNNAHIPYQGITADGDSIEVRFC